MKYWHFLPEDKRLQFGDRELVKVKHTLMLPPETKVIPCETGFHASARAIDALMYAPGPIVCRVTLHGKIVPHGNPVDKYAAQGRTVLWMADATEVMREFSRWIALQVIHLWDAPDVVKEYLQTGKEELRDAAGDAAWAAARAAARDAAGDAARAAARDAARAAAGDAAWAAAWAAARAAAWAAAGDAAGDAQNKRFEEMLLNLGPK